MRKLDPYLNVDPGTMNPCQHGEVFVTDDGTEADLDLGHYERFSGVPAKRTDSITTGKIYQRVIEKERHGFYLGSTIQVIPHVTNEIKDFILSDISDEDFAMAIADIAKVASSETSVVLSQYLDFLNKKMENREPPVQTVILAVINALGGLGDKTAFDYLLYVTYLDYPEEVIAAAKNALSKLKW